MPSIGPIELLIILLPFWVVPAIVVGRFAERRGQSFTLFCLLSLVVSWVLVLVGLLIITQPGTPEEQPTPEQPVGSWGVTTGDDAYAGEHEPRDGRPQG